jgi:hypothetical protein
MTNAAALEAQVVAVLVADPRLAGATVAATADPPPAESCPAVRVAVAAVDRDPLLLTGSLRDGGSFERATVAVDCIEFSAAGPSDARAAALALAHTVVAVLADAPTLGGFVLVAYPRRVTVETAGTGGGGIFAVARVELECQALG